MYVYVYDNISKDNNSKFPKSPNPHSYCGFGNGVESVQTVPNKEYKHISADRHSFVMLEMSSYFSAGGVQQKRLTRDKNLESISFLLIRCTFWPLFTFFYSIALIYNLYECI